jgi:hypothetical protein
MGVDRADDAAFAARWCAPVALDWACCLFEFLISHCGTLHFSGASPPIACPVPEDAAHVELLNRAEGPIDPDRHRPALPRHTRWRKSVLLGQNRDGERDRGEQHHRQQVRDGNHQFQPNLPSPKPALACSVVDILIVDNREKPGLETCPFLPEMLPGQRTLQTVLDKIINKLAVPR